MLEIVFYVRPGLKMGQGSLAPGNTVTVYGDEMWQVLLESI